MILFILGGWLFLAVVTTAWLTGIFREGRRQDHLRAIYLERERRDEQERSLNGHGSRSAVPPLSKIERKSP